MDVFVVGIWNCKDFVIIIEMLYEKNLKYSVNVFSSCFISID